MISMSVLRDLRIQRGLQEMAQKVNIILVDDIDGSEATETVSFGLDGTSYEIDLNDANAAALRDALAGYIGHGRKVGSAPRRGGRRGGSGGGSGSGSATGPSAREIRDWARSNGYDVPDRGRVSAEVRDAYDKAH
jgi:Lsr2